LFNNNKDSCASFMNLRDDGMPVKFVLNYTVYTVEDQVDDEIVYWIQENLQNWRNEFARIKRS
jgi:hypothetical protein